MRMTAFPAQPHAIDLTTWTSLVGGQPDQARFSPLFEASKNLGAGEILLRGTPANIDIIRTGEVKPTGFPDLGDFTAALGLLTPFVDKWLSMAPDIGRLAFAGQALLPVARPDDGYVILKKLLKESVDVSPYGDVSDLLYQINRPVSAKTSGLPSGVRINRLAKWAAVTAHVQPVGPNTFFSSATLSSAVSCEFDINNTNFANLAFDRLTAASLFKEFISLLPALLTHGDQP